MNLAQFRRLLFSHIRMIDVVAFWDPIPKLPYTAFKPTPVDIKLIS